MTVLHFLRRSQVWKRSAARFRTARRQRTLRSFLGDRVKLQLRGSAVHLVGRFTALGAWSGTFVPDGGVAGPLDYAGILSCEVAP